MSRYMRSNIKINSFADLIAPDDKEVNEIPLEDLHEFKDHPFKVLDDYKMKELVESVKSHGVMMPGIVRASADGGYEIISGHRRKRACELAGLATMPVIIKKLNDDDAAIIMVDTNLRQREEILPSEKAFAYKMKLEALAHQGKRDETLTTQVGWRAETANLIGETTGDSKNQVRRYIRLTELNKELLEMVDRKKMKLNPAVELSYLTKKHQEILLKVIDEEGKVPSLSQAQRIKRLSQDGGYNKEGVRAILVGPFIQGRQVTISESIVMRYFTPDTSNEDIEKLICTLLEGWKAGGGSL